MQREDADGYLTQMASKDEKEGAGTSGGNNKC